MSTVRMLARESLRKKLSSRAKEGREKLKAAVKDNNLSYEEKLEAAIALNKRPRDESSSRCSTRCSRCGRSHAVYRKFKMCRLCIRKILMLGFVPGVRKASW